MTVTFLGKIDYKEAMRNKIYNIKKGKREKRKFFGGTFLRAKKMERNTILSSCVRQMHTCAVFSKLHK